MLYRYLCNRGVKDKAYIDYLKKIDSFQMGFRLTSINGFDFKVIQLFDKTDYPGRGLIVTNEILGTDHGDIVAIGAIDGDDLVCIDVARGKIVIWMIENGEGEYLDIADSFSEFAEMALININF